MPFKCPQAYWFVCKVTVRWKAKLGFLRIFCTCTKWPSRQRYSWSLQWARLHMYYVPWCFVLEFSAILWCRCWRRSNLDVVFVFLLDVVIVVLVYVDDDGITPSSATTQRPIEKSRRMRHAFPSVDLVVAAFEEMVYSVPFRSNRSPGRRQLRRDFTEWLTMMKSTKPSCLLEYWTCGKLLQTWAGSRETAGDCWTSAAATNTI